MKIAQLRERADGLFAPRPCGNALWPERDPSRTADKHRDHISGTGFAKRSWLGCAWIYNWWAGARRYIAKTVCVADRQIVEPAPECRVLRNREVGLAFDRVERTTVDEPDTNPVVARRSFRKSECRIFLSCLR